MSAFWVKFIRRFFVESRWSYAYALLVFAVWSSILAMILVTAYRLTRGGMFPGASVHLVFWWLLSSGWKYACATALGLPLIFVFVMELSLYRKGESLFLKRFLPLYYFCFAILIAGPAIIIWRTSNSPPPNLIRVTNAIAQGPASFELRVLGSKLENEIVLKSDDLELVGLSSNDGRWILNFLFTSEAAERLSKAIGQTENTDVIVSLDGKVVSKSEIPPSRPEVGRELDLVADSRDNAYEMAFRFNARNNFQNREQLLEPVRW